MPRESQGAMNRMRERTCDTCGVEFHKTSKPGKNGSFCSRKCRDAVKLSDCENCGQQFHALDRQKKTCSAKCRLEQIARKNTKNIDRECRWCGKAFSVRPSRLKRKPSTFCSLHCHNSRQKFTAWMRDKQRELQHRTNPDARIEKADAMGRRLLELSWRPGKQCKWTRRLSSMVSCNRFRGEMASRVESHKSIASQNTRQNRVHSTQWRWGCKWLAVFSLMNKSTNLHQASKADRWAWKLQSIVHNQRTRQRRKHAEKMLRQND